MNGQIGQNGFRADEWKIIVVVVALIEFHWASAGAGVSD